MFTGFYDDNKKGIFLGDILLSKYGYKVIVKSDKNGFYGQLVCKDSHSCKDIPYALNSGKGFLKLINSK